MASKLIILPSARQDLHEASGWYHQINPDLSDEFIEAVNAAFIVIEKHAQLQQKIYNNFRKVNLKKFPYKIIYQVGKEEITIIAVAHHKRHPGYWKRRK